MQRQRVTENGLLPPPFAGAWLWQNDARLNASWDLDLFGRNRKLLDAAVGAQRAAEADAQSARVLLATNVARGYVALGRLQARRAVVDDTVRSREQILAIVRDRVNAGLDTTVELRQAEGALPEIRQQRAALDEAIALTRNALAALIGAGPQATATLTAPLAALPAPTPPASLPAELLARRADVVAARWRVESALRGVDAARAEFYPNVNLLAFAGLTSLGFSHWLEAGSRTIGIGPAIHLPIFEAGRLRANLGARSAETDGAIAAYNGALIDAVHEVADAVASRRAVDEQVSEQRQAQAAAESAYDLSLQRYRAGLGTYLTVLTAEGNVLAQRLAANDLKARTLDLDVALIRALGGGYRANADALLAAADEPAGSSPASNR
jgi:NodT family efflux transporter outer membrane factor (OMF) lipoprotein